MPHKYDMHILSGWHIPYSFCRKMAQVSSQTMATYVLLRYLHPKKITVIHPSVIGYTELSFPRPPKKIEGLP